MNIYVTRMIPAVGTDALKAKGWNVVVNAEDRTLTKDELIAALKMQPYDAVLCLLTDKVDDDVLAAAGPQCKIFANYAVGFDNIDTVAASARGIIVTNTPGVLSNSVAEHTLALIMALAHRVVEADRFVRSGGFEGWEPMLMLGTDLTGKTLGIVGCGGIGAQVARSLAKGFGMKVIYHDTKPNEALDAEIGSIYKAEVDDVFKDADVVSLHVPLLPTTTHLADDRRLRLMKPTALLVNTSRGPVVDEAALVKVLQEKAIAGAALDVFEHEPALAPGLTDLGQVIITPHIASATVETRNAMSDLAAKNIIEVLEGRVAVTPVKTA